MNAQRINNLKNQALSSIFEATTAKEIEELRIKYLGRNGLVVEQIKTIPSLPESEKKEAGRIINEIKQAIGSALETQMSVVGVKEVEEKSWLDVSAPGPRKKVGHLSPISQTIEEITRIFEKIGFARVAYPEVEWDWYAFEGLNMPANHPARDEWETFFVKGIGNPKYGNAVLTPHTSSGQVREMERVKTPPIRMLNIAKCYRRQADVSHLPMFYQFEGLAIDKQLSIVDLQSILSYFTHQYFGSDRKTRIRPFHFQFTEPSFEVDVTCIVCHGKARLPNGQGCKVCKEGWMELGGAGMVHPNVLKNGGIDPEKYSGFAWGWGVERVMMMRYGIDDIRLLLANDIRFLEQF